MEKFTPNWRKIAVHGFPPDKTECLVRARYPGTLKIATYREGSIEPWDGCYTWTPEEYIPTSELQ